MHRSTRFLVEVLGLRVVKRTVHHHDPRLPVAIFDCGAGTPIVTYVEWSPIFYALPAAGLVDPATTAAALDAPRVGDFKGRWGAGTNHHLALHTRSREQLLQWKRYLCDFGVHVTGPYFRNYFNAIYFRDPDGAIIEIATTEPGFAYDEDVLGSTHQPPKPGAMVGARSEVDVAHERWPEPVPALTEAMRLLGFHHNTSISSNIDRTTTFFTDRVGLDLIKRTDYLDEEGGTHYYFAAGPEVAPGAILTFFGLPGYAPGRLGVGLSHHIALAVADDAALEQWREVALSAGLDVGPVEDLTYYRAAVFRDPDGHLLQVATPPDFTIDEAPDALGQRLCLPEHLEARREEFERVHGLRPAPVPRLASSAALRALS
jgi:catechol 2,3-dioxygenase-like lactoylglutathione lyase family enzyme